MEWEEAVAIWMQKTQMQKEIPRVNEFHSPLPFFCFSWCSLLEGPAEVRKKKEVKQASLQTVLPIKVSRYVAPGAKVTHTAAWLG